MNAVQKATDDLASRLRGRGYRLTPQRELILQAVEDLGHATPEEILERVQGRTSAINASTVYRTLELLGELGLVRQAHLGGRTPTFHSTSGPAHGHLVCRECGSQVGLAGPSAQEFVARLHEESGFTTEVSDLTVFGTCAGCTAAGPS